MSDSFKRSAGGHLLRNSSGHLVNQCDDDEPTCDIDCTGLASAYTVAGSGSLTGCSTCDDSSDSAWDGVLEQVDDVCMWLLNAAVSIGGKEPSYSLGIWGDCSTTHTNGVGVWFNTVTCQWELAITCRNTGEYHVIWVGVKSEGLSPAGVYTRVCGCDETPTLTVS